MFLERPAATHHHIHAWKRMDRLTQELNNLRLSIVSKVKYTLASLQRILATTPTSPANLHPNNKTHKSSSWLLPFIGQVSKVLFGTADKNDVCTQQVGVDKAIRLGNLNARQLNYLGNALKKVMVIDKENMGFNLESVMANTGAVQNISIAFGRYTVHKNILVQLDLQIKLLISDVITLRNGLLRLTLVTYAEMLHFKTISEMFKSGRLYTTPALVGNVLIVTLHVPLHSRRQSFSPLKSKTFPLPIHGHLSQIVHIPTYLIVSSSQIGLPNADAATRCEYMSNEDTCHIEVATQHLPLTDCVTALIFNFIKDVKKYCQFKLFIQSVLRPTRIDYLIHS